MSYLLTSSDSEDELPLPPRTKHVRLCDILRQTSSPNIPSGDTDAGTLHQSLAGNSLAGNDVYSSCVSKAFSKLSSVNMDAIYKDMENDSDCKDSAESWYFGKKKTTEQRVQCPRRRLRSNAAEARPETPDVMDVPSTACISLHDSDIELETSYGNLLSISTPLSMPVTPSPKGPRGRTKRGRRGKGVKKAIDLLSQASKLIGTEVDKDLSIVSVSPSPRKTPQVHKIMVKIRCKSSLQRFPMGATDSFSCVMKQLAESEGVDDDFIHIYLNDQLVEPFHTPSSLGIGVADILHCHIKKTQTSSLHRLQSDELLLGDPNFISLKVQGQNPRSRRTVIINKREPLGKLMKEYCSLLSLPYGQLVFKFDGEEVNATDTAEEWDLETDFCIDVVGL